jgi:hypothetical protein
MMKPRDVRGRGAVSGAAHLRASRVGEAEDRGRLQQEDGAVDSVLTIDTCGHVSAHEERAARRQTVSSAGRNK